MGRQRFRSGVNLFCRLVMSTCYVSFLCQLVFPAFYVTCDLSLFCQLFLSTYYVILFVRSACSVGLCYVNLITQLVMSTCYINLCQLLYKLVTPTCYVNLLPQLIMSTYLLCQLLVSQTSYDKFIMLTCFVNMLCVNLLTFDIFSKIFKM